MLLGNRDGNGTFQFQAQQTLSAGSEPKAVALADLNGDGKADLVVMDATLSPFDWATGTGRSRLPMHSRWVTTQLAWPWGISTAMACRI